MRHPSRGLLGYFPFAVVRISDFYILTRGSQAKPSFATIMNYPNGAPCFWMIGAIKNGRLKPAELKVQWKNVISQIVISSQKNPRKLQRCCYSLRSELFRTKWWKIHDKIHSCHLLSSKWASLKNCFTVVFRCFHVKNLLLEPIGGANFKLAQLAASLPETHKKNGKDALSEQKQGKNNVLPQISYFISCHCWSFFQFAYELTKIWTKKKDSWLSSSRSSEFLTFVLIKNAKACRWTSREFFRGSSWEGGLGWKA